ncbi:hypothetical protein DIPPA_00835 [Diplonema papillatum]|nr:hypothetical protein DIPPA_00835 [Diplonema papillatum]
MSYKTGNRCNLRKQHDELTVILVSCGSFDISELDMPSEIEMRKSTLDHEEECRQSLVRSCYAGLMRLAFAQAREAMHSPSATGAHTRDASGPHIVHTVPAAVDRDAAAAATRRPGESSLAYIHRLSCNRKKRVAVAR